MPNAKDIVLKLRSLTNEFRTDAAATELDQLEKALKGTATQAGKSAREVRAAADDLDAPGFDRAAAEAETTARRMREAAADMATGIRGGAQDIDRETDKIRADMADTGREAGGELVQNIAEGIGSGSGSITDVMQGTLGGLTTMISGAAGPIGVAAGAAAAGFGVFFSALKKQQEEAKARFDLLIGAIEEVGNVASEAGKQALFAAWVEDVNKVPGAMAKIVKGLDQSGLNTQVLYDAMTGNVDAIKEIQKALGIIDRTTGLIKVGAGGWLDTSQELTDEQAYLLEQIELQNGALSEVVAAREAEKRVMEGAQRAYHYQWQQVEALRKKAVEYGEAMDEASKDRTIRIRMLASLQDPSGAFRMPDPRARTGRGD